MKERQVTPKAEVMERKTVTVWTVAQPDPPAPWIDPQFWARPYIPRDEIDRLRREHYEGHIPEKARCERHGVYYVAFKDADGRPRCHMCGGLVLGLDDDSFAANISRALDYFWGRSPDDRAGIEAIRLEAIRRMYRSAEAYIAERYHLGLDTEYVAGLDGAADSTLLFKEDLCQAFGISKRTLERHLIESGTVGFPRGRLVGGRRCWLLSELASFIHRCAIERSGLGLNQPRLNQPEEKE